MEQKQKTVGNVNIRKGATIGLLKQVYDKDNESKNCIVEEYLKESFKEYFEIEDRLRQLELLMSDNSQNLELLLQKYGRLQEKYISIGGYELEEKFKKICSGFKFNNEFLKKEYSYLSGGEKTIVNLAAILLESPSILLLDEPTNHLDIETLEWLEAFLIAYKGTILLISHDRYFLNRVATKTVLLERGHTSIYFGNYSYFIEEDERRTLAEFEAYKNQQKQIEKMQTAIKKLKSFGQLEGNEIFFKRAKSIEKRLKKMQVLDEVKIEKKKMPINISSYGKTGKEILIIQNLNKSFGDNVIFKDFNMGVYSGEKVQLRGKNGSRKINLDKYYIRKR